MGVDARIWVVCDPDLDDLIKNQAEDYGLVYQETTWRAFTRDGSRLYVDGLGRWYDPEASMSRHGLWPHYASWIAFLSAFGPTFYASENDDPDGVKEFTLARWQEAWSAWRKSIDTVPWDDM